MSSPEAIAMNMAPISVAFPGTERNLTRLNAPATAIPTPMLSLTTMMMTATTAGMMATVIRKPSLYSLLYA